MIFISVGTQLPFDRLVEIVDDWAGNVGGVDIFAQIGPGKYSPRNFKAVDFLKPNEISACYEKSSIIVAHAGMGTVLTAMKIRKPIIIFPRRFELGEHRNDHQMATARWLKDKLDIPVAFERDELLELLSARSGIAAPRYISDYAPAGFIDRLHKALHAI